MPRAIPKTMIKMGDTLSNPTINATEIGIQSVFHVISAFLPILNNGAKIRATTAGRIPLKTDSTTSFSRN